uniref:Reverse transcriptase domain-containing protein n=1 Tax=Tanacetum cinerariifolium TaxID=118510 RepID=A0A699GZS7_TANCI|nr:reverse transcriptase domain-containing protein [Tanacetum cinerariifolium]
MRYLFVYMAARITGPDPVTPSNHTRYEGNSGQDNTNRSILEGHLLALKELLKETGNNDLIKLILLNFSDDGQDIDEEIEEIDKRKDRGKVTMNDEDLSRPFKEVLKRSHKSFHRNQKPRRMAHVRVVSNVPADTRRFGMLRACAKDPMEISKIVRRANESLPNFKERWTAYPRLLMRCSKGWMIMSDQKKPFVILSYPKISSFMSSHRCPALSKRFSDGIPKTVDEMLKRVDDDVRSEEAFRNTELPKGKLKHLVKDVRHTGKNRRKGNSSQKGKIINVVRCQAKNRKRKTMMTDEEWMRVPTTFSPVLARDLSDEVLVVETKIEGYLVRRVHIDEGASIEIMYEHCFNMLHQTINKDTYDYIWIFGRAGGSNLGISLYHGIRVQKDKKKQTMESPKEAKPQGSQKRRILSPEKSQVVTKEVTEWLKAGIVRPVRYHTYISNPVLVKKVNVSWRMCIDFKNINVACLKDYYPLLEIDIKIEPVVGFPLKCFLDAYKGYHQVQMAEEEKEKTAFYTDQEAYVYEMFVKCRTDNEMIADVEETFDNLRKINMKLNPKKYSFGVEEGKILGYMVTSKGIRANLAKTKDIAKIIKEDYPQPTVSYNIAAKVNVVRLPGSITRGGLVWRCDRLVSRAKVIENQVMDAPVISISSNLSDESVGSSFPRVILIGSISVEVLVAPEVRAAAVASPTRTIQSQILRCPRGMYHLTPYDAMLTRWRSRVASRSSSPTTSTPEIPTTPIPPAPSAVVAPSTDINSPVDHSYSDHSSSGHCASDHSSLDHSSSRHSISGHSLFGHTPPVTIIANSFAPSRLFYPPFARTPRYSEAYHCWRPPTATMTSSIYDSKALVPSRADLLPPRKRFRDSISLKDSVEEYIDTYVLVDIKADATAIEVVADIDVEAGVDAGIGMAVDVRVDVEDEVEGEYIPSEYTPLYNCSCH